MFFREEGRGIADRTYLKEDSREERKEEALPIGPDSKFIFEGREEVLPIGPDEKCISEGRGDILLIAPDNRRMSEGRGNMLPRGSGSR